jgi:membrane-bound lytic murein transglycosylase B
MQFLPSTWRRWGVDADRDHAANPQDIRDAAAAAGDYLCAAGGDLATADGVTTAVFAYNHSTDYVRAVVTAAQYYGGITPATSTALAALPAAAPEVSLPAASPSPRAVPQPRPTRTNAPSPSPSPSPLVSPTQSPSDSPPPQPYDDPGFTEPSPAP